MKFKISKKQRNIILISLGALLLITILGTGIFYFYVRSKIYVPNSKPVSSNKEGNTNGEDNVEYEEQEGITNILLIGTDGRDLKEASRSDTMIILTIDDNTKKIKLTSILRDTYVEIKGHKTQKINASYAIGGPELLMDTIERNFKIKLDKYVIVNFWGFQDIIDSIGGLDIEVKDYEVSEINKFIGEVNDQKSPPLKGPGLQHLDGQQALAYSRIRHVGNGSYERTQRQRYVLTLMANKLKETSKIQYPVVLSKLLPYIKTNIEPISIINYAYTISKFKPLEIKQLQMPMTELSDGRIYNGTWVFLMDKNQNSKVLNDFIFRDKEPNVKDLDYKTFKSIIDDYLKEEIKTNPDVKQDDPENKVEPKESDHTIKQ